MNSYIFRDIEVWYDQKQDLYHYSSDSIGCCFNSKKELEKFMHEVISIRINELKSNKAIK